MELQSTIFNFISNYSKSFLISFCVLFFGILLSRKINRILVVFWQKTGLSLNIERILEYLIKFLLYFTMASLILNQFGFNIWAVLAPLGASIIALSVILKESLTDFISGVFIVLNQSIHIGDYIEISSVKGEVIQIGNFCTTLHTEDNKTAVIPNSKITSGILIRKSKYDYLCANLFLTIKNKSGKKVKNYVKDLKNFKEMLEMYSLMYINEITTPPPPHLKFISTNKDEHTATAKFTVWTNKNSYNKVIELLQNLINNKIVNSFTDLCIEVSCDDDDNASSHN